MNRCSRADDLNDVGVMTFTMHVKSELVREMFGALARHSHSATWRSQTKLTRCDPPHTSPHRCLYIPQRQTPFAMRCPSRLPQAAKVMWPCALHPA
jgi:hypothetical protein